MEAPETRWDPKEVDEAAASISGFLDENPAHWVELEEILQHQLSVPITPDTGYRFVSALELLGDEQFSGFMAGFLVYGDEDEELRDQLLSQVSIPLRSYLRKLLAIYGPAATEAQILAGEHPDGWRDLRREVYRDVITDVWRVRLEIDRFGGQTVTLEETPSSVAVLTQGLIDTLTAAVMNAGIEVIDPAVKTVLLDEMIAFLKIADTAGEADD